MSARCFPDNEEQPKLIDPLDELGYPVDRTVKAAGRTGALKPEARKVRQPRRERAAAGR
jgi:hypothetical protein